MNRNFTNMVRFFLDECVPPIIRDSRWFMYPFYLVGYRGRNINQAMAFKRNVVQMSPQEYQEFYASLNSISRNRNTDLSSACVAAIMAKVATYKAPRILDAGCGNGHLTELIRKLHPDSEVYCLDLVQPATALSGYCRSAIDRMPFVDEAFDIVICAHTLEHCLDLPVVLSELKRVCKTELMIVVPRQRPYFYTVDEHVQFFFYQEQLTFAIGLKQFECVSIKGDWFYCGKMSSPPAIASAAPAESALPAV